MEEAVRIILESGKSAIDVALYVLLPVMVVMAAIMKVLEAKGVLAFVSRLLSPLLRVFGIPGIGIFAVLQLLFVGFAAPLATLTIMEKNRTEKAKVAATLAMLLAMSQGNVVFPMLAVGLNLWMVLFTSLVGGLVAAFLTYRFFCSEWQSDPSSSDGVAQHPERKTGTSVLNLLKDGGQEGVQIVLKSIPFLVLAILLVDILSSIGLIAFMGRKLSPALETVGLPGIAVLPFATKYLAGGTAMMGMTFDLVNQGAITPLELNRLAGFLINPLDLVGVGVLLSAGPRTESVAKAAMKGAVVGILVRGVLHLILF